jgi:conjugative relaxase-like TrwC/TraI family protein
MDYYNDSSEAPGKWFGAGAEELGLEGTIDDRGIFKKIFQGFNKQGEKLVQNAGSNDRRHALDLTFSAPKSFSVLWGIADEEHRKRLELIERKAVESTLEEVADHVFTRRGKGGVVKEKCKIVFALFAHSTSRAEEPQRHTHCLLMNVGVREDGKTSSLETANIYRMKNTLGALYRSELARLLKQEYQLEFERVKNSVELLGRDENLCDFFSSRSKKIEQHLKEYGVADTAANRERACLFNRESKQKISQRENFIRWQEQAVIQRGVTFDNLLSKMQLATKSNSVSYGVILEASPEQEVNLKKK